MERFHRGQTFFSYTPMFNVILCCCCCFRIALQCVCAFHKLLNLTDSLCCSDRPTTCRRTGTGWAPPLWLSSFPHWCSSKEGGRSRDVRWWTVRAEPCPGPSMRYDLSYLSLSYPEYIQTTPSVLVRCWATTTQQLQFSFAQIAVQHVRPNSYTGTCKREYWNVLFCFNLFVTCLWNYLLGEHHQRVQPQWALPEIQEAVQESRRE